jgi:hypothetical protein
LAAPDGLAGEGVRSNTRHTHFGAVHHRHTNLAGRLVHLGRTAKSIVVGHSESRVSQFGSNRDQLSGMRSSVEEAHIGVAMQLCVSNHE